MHRASNAKRGGEIEFKMQIKRKGLGEEVAALVAWLLCDSSSYITGTVQVFHLIFPLDRRLLTAIVD